MDEGYKRQEVPSEGTSPSGQGDSVTAAKTFSFQAFCAEIDKRWSSAKFLGFGCYYAWIWLCYDSRVLVPQSLSESVANSLYLMYVLSTLALALVLIVLAFASNRVERLLNRSSFLIAAGLFATISTLIVAFSAADPDLFVVFLIASAATGLGTGCIALSLGMTYSTIPAREVVMHTAASFVLAAMLYFVAIGLPQYLGVLLAAALPLLAAFGSIIAVNSKDSSVHEASKQAKLSKNELPRGFIARSVLTIAVFALAVGVTRGFTALQESAFSLQGTGTMIVFATAIICGVLIVVVGMTSHSFDISKLYYPIALLASLGILGMPLISMVGGLQSGNGFEGSVIGVAYALFIFVMWCLFAHISHQTDYSPVFVFGLGRGASAVGTTVGWLLGALLLQVADDDQTFLIGVSIAMVLALLLFVMVVFNDQSISMVVYVDQDKRGFSARGRSRRGASRMKDLAEDAGDHPGSWTVSCNYIADQANLSPREREVLFLLSKGRTIDYIHNELNISTNTAKTHIRKVYTKLGVHTRQELLDMVEKHRDRF